MKKHYAIETSDNCKKMDLETGCVDILFEKPGSKVGRDHRGPGLNPTVVKVIKGTDVSKNKAKLLSNSVFEDLSPEVCYSLKKKNRWQQLHSVHSVLTTVAGHSPSFNVSAVEKNVGNSILNDNRLNKGVRVYGRVKAGSDKVERMWTKSKTGGDGLSLEDALEGRGDRRRRKQKKGPREPEVMFVIEKGLCRGSPKQTKDKSQGGRKARSSVKSPHHIHHEEISNDFDEDILDEIEENFVDEKNENFDELIDDFVDVSPKDVFGEPLEDLVDEVTDELIDEVIDENSDRNFKLSDFIKNPSPKKIKIKDFVFVDEAPSEIIEI